MNDGVDDRQLLLLRGRVYYYCRLKHDTNIISTFADDDNDDDATKKRKRVGTTATSTTTDAAREESSSDNVKLSSSSSSLHLGVPLEGWIFHALPQDDRAGRTIHGTCHSSNNNSDHHGYYALLCVPQSCESILWAASRSSSIISLCRGGGVTIVPLTPSSTQQPRILISRTSASSTITISALICVSKSSFISSMTPSMDRVNDPWRWDQPEQEDSEIWTLRQLAQSETCEAVAASTTQATQTKKKKRHYSFMGRVVTTSPILSVHGKDPFVLMELVHTERHSTHSTEITTTTTTEGNHSEQNDEPVLLQYHCVVVMRKLGLTCHTSMVPYDTMVVLRQVRKQQWRIPELFASVSPSVEVDQSTTTTTISPPPLSVFVVDSPTQISFGISTWRPSDIFHDSDTTSAFVSSTKCGVVPPPLPFSDTTTVTGRIHHVHFPSPQGPCDERQRSQPVHSIEIITTLSSPEEEEQQHQVPPRQNKICLYTSHYPMSTSLSLLLHLHAQISQHQCKESTLRMELYVKVHNVQCLGYNGYAANVYTSFTIMDICIPETIHGRVYDMMQLLPFPFPYDTVDEAQQLHYEPSWIHDFIHTTIYAKSSFGPKWTSKMSHKASSDLWSIINNKTNESSTSTKRNVYTAFFSRPKYGLSQNDNVAISGIAPTIPVINFPFPISIPDIQQQSFRAIFHRLRQLDVDAIKIGWTGMKQYIGPSMYELFVSQRPDAVKYDVDFQQKIMFTFGRCCIGDVPEKEHSRKSVSISDGNVTLPIVFIGDETVDLSTLSDHSNFMNNALAWVSIHAVSISCIYLGVTTAENGNEENDWKPLPPYCDTDPTMSHGACALCTVNGHLFMISVYIIGDQLYNIECSNSELKQYSATRLDTLSAISLEQCLNPKCWNNETLSSPSVVGLLARGTYKLGKVKSNVYSHFTMALAHIPIDETNRKSDVLCTLQCLDFKPTITLDSAKWISLQCHINTLLAVQTAISEERLTLGIVWWKMASCPSTCALQNGGWDALRQKQRNPKLFGVVVRLPTTSIFRDTVRGFTRIRCCVDDIDAYVRLFDQPEDSRVLDSTASEPWFDFVGSSDKFLPGTLDCLPRRRQTGHFAVGERLMYIESAASGAPRNRLSDLAALLCCDLKSTTGRSHLAPSFTREIRDANFMGINFCRARAECSQCYEVLCNPEEQRDDSTYLPPVSNWKQSQHDQILSERRTTLLRCPNGCRMDLHGSIKWECSGLLDDGTGQAKLCAERDAAICLLGLSTTTVKHIETAIWRSHRADGFIYLKTMPPPSFLQSAVLQARATARQNIQRTPGKDVRRMTDADVVQFMSSCHYGEYLFHSHCRASFEPMRSLTYFVRCKPLHDKTITLNQTEIDIVTIRATTSDCHTDNTGKMLVTTTTTPTQSYSLPPIILNLVDCCCPF